MESDLIRGVIAAGIQGVGLVAAVVLIPSLVQGIGGTIGKLAGMVNNPQKGLRDRANKAAGAYSERLGREQQDKYLKGSSRAGALTRWGARRKARNRDSEQNLAESSTAYIANKALNDERFAMQLAGGDRARLAVVRGRADDLLTQQNAKIRGTYVNNLGRNSAMLAAGGFTYNGNEFFRNGAAVSETDVVKYFTNGKTHDENGNEIKVDAATRGELKFASENDLANSSNGARALATVMAQKGSLNSERIATLAENVRKVDGIGAESIFLEHTNAEAGSSGMAHLSYNKVLPQDAPGNVALGAGKGGVSSTAKFVLEKNGLPGITKEMYEDPNFGSAFAEHIIKLKVNQPQQFSRETARLTDAQLDKLASALSTDAAAAGMPGQSKGQILDELKKTRTRAAREYKAA